MSMRRTRLLLLAVVTALSVVACSADRTRNAGIVDGAPCKKAGQVSAAGALTVVCGRDAGKSVWFAVDANQKSSTRCRPLGKVRRGSSSVRVCGKSNGRALWFKAKQVSAPATTSASESTVIPESTSPSANSQTPTITGNIADAAGAADVSEVQVVVDAPTFEGVVWDVPARAWSSDASVSIPAVTMGSDRTATYSVAATGSTGCALDVESMELTFDGAGWCELSADVAPNEKFFGETINVGVLVADACRAGYRCQVGEVGPGGGRVIHVASQPQEWGTYIELAPPGWSEGFEPKYDREVVGSQNADPKIAWCPENAGSTYFWDSAGIGRGKANTDGMVRAKCRAATFVDGVSFNGVDDWVIPSAGDLEIICSFLKAGAQRSQCRASEDPTADELGFPSTATHYWSSSVDYAASTLSAVGRRVTSTSAYMTKFVWPQHLALWVRPVRYFGPQTQSGFWVGPRNVDFGSPATLFASGGTGDGAVTFAVFDAGSANCSIRDGKLESTDIGTCSIVATRAASGSFVETTSEPVVITIKRSQPRIYVRAYHGFAGNFQDPITLQVILPPRMDAVTFTVVDDRGTGCTVSGYELRAPRVGKCVVEASFAGDQRYEPGKSQPFEATFMQSCETGGDCYPGSTGPGGGTIFFMTGPRSWFTDFRTGQGARYLEVAPADWGTRTKAPWGCEKVQITESDLRYPGGGGANTDQFLKQCLEFNNVFKLAAAYRGGDKTDWYVPSLAELNELCKYARKQLVGDFSLKCSGQGELREGYESGIYWSSTQYGTTLANAQLFGPSDLLPRLSAGSPTTLTKTQAAVVRPIRSFCAGYCPYFPTTTTSNG